MWARPININNKPPQHAPLRLGPQLLEGDLLLEPQRAPGDARRVLQGLRRRLPQEGAPCQVEPHRAQREDEGLQGL